MMVLLLASALLATEPGPTPNPEASPETKPGTNPATNLAPIVVSATELRYAVADHVPGELLERRVEHFDERGRLLRWSEWEADGTHRLTWIGNYWGDETSPRRAAYWQADQDVPFSELMVSSEDGRIVDVLYGSVGEKPRREIREYKDAHGREMYQEYFGPRSQNKYGEEIYRYDAAGNNVYKIWRSLKGTAQKETVYEVVATDENGRWTRRKVTIDGEFTAIDERHLVYGTAKIAIPPAAQGPVASSNVILPVPFAPGVVTTARHGENALTFSPDGETVLFSRYGEDWTDQAGYLAQWSNGAWREATEVPFLASMYNAALRDDGEAMVWCRRDDALGGGRVFVCTKTADGWSESTDLTALTGFTGSYFRWLADGTAYYHRDGDLYRCVLDATGAQDEQRLPGPINTEATEFGAWVDSDERRILFTRDVESAPDESGVFVAVKQGSQWGEPRRLPVPYGWSPVLSPDGEDLVYVIDEDVVRVPVALLDLP